MSPPIVDSLQRTMLEEHATGSKIRDALLWFYDPLAIVHAPRLRTRGVIYDCMDELSNFVGAPPMLRQRERDLFGLADLVFTGGHSLYEAKRSHHPRVYAFPSSVDAAHFGKARSTLAEPDGQRGIPHPRIGFFGVIDERMDLELVRAVAEARPHYQFVFIGPVAKIDHARLPRLPNIHWLGARGYDELPPYIASWDVAMMPFARNEATRFISPTKTLEYLAAGKPVVSTSIRDVVRPYGEEGLVRIADTPSAFAAALDGAIAERTTEEGRRRRAAADAMLAQTSWDRTWARMNELLAELSRA
jgi:UDP-galactopyranose mutase